MLVFILFIFAKIWPAVLLGLFLSSLAWWLGWSKGISLYALSLSLLLGLAILFPIGWVAFYLSLLVGLMSLVNRFLPESVWKVSLLIFLSMGSLVVPYLLMVGAATSFSYGYGHFTHQGKTYTVVYEREHVAFLHLDQVTLTEYLYPAGALRPSGQVRKERAAYDGENNPGLSFVLPTSQAEEEVYLNRFE